jgi:hypothetical protein
VASQVTAKIRRVGVIFLGRRFFGACTGEVERNASVNIIGAHIGGDAAVAQARIFFFFFFFFGDPCTARE